MRRSSRLLDLSGLEADWQIFHSSPSDRARAKFMMSADMPDRYGY